MSLLLYYASDMAPCRYYHDNLPNGQPDFSRVIAISAATTAVSNGIVDLVLGPDGYLYLVDLPSESCCWTS